MVMLSLVLQHLIDPEGPGVVALGIGDRGRGWCPSDLEMHLMTF